MYFSYYEEDRGELYFQSLLYPFTLMFSERILLLFMVSLN